MKVQLNKNFLPEKAYIINTLLKEYLGLNFTIEAKADIQNVQIHLNNGSILIIEDHFFETHKNSTYLAKENIPKTTVIFNSSFNTRSDLPCIYGNTSIKIDTNKITCGLDIFASSFFMLTRWEEYVNKERDHHQRFSSKSSLPYQNNFLNRPVVNEYTVLLWNMLVHLGIDQVKKVRTFKITPTHDVDLPRLWWNFKDFSKSIAGDLFKRKDLKSVFWSIKNYTKSVFGKKDPFDTFDLLMSLSEKNKLKSHFFFMSGGTSNKDNFYKINHPLIIKLMKEIDKRGHIIGFHPSYNAYNDSVQFKKELDELQKYAPQKINCGRQHYLRFENPTTWNVWEENNMKWDSTLSFADYEGFRCGTCYSFPIFDIINRKQLKLIERPLIVMDGSLVTYQNISLEEGYQKINNLIEEVKKYEGEFVFLWHNSAFNTLNWKPFQQIYGKIINENPNHHRG